MTEIEVSPDLIAFLKQEYDRCIDEQLEDERVTAIDRYNGEPYGDEQAGRSQVVARDTAEVTDYMVISILRAIVSGDDVVEFQHKNAALAHQATQTIKWLLMKRQDGYRVIHDWLKAGLLEKNAVAMTYVEPQPPKRTMLEGVSALALIAMQEQGRQVVEAEETGQEGPEGPIFNVTLSEPQPPKFCDAAVPNEEFYCSPDARTITEAPLKGRKVRKTISDLVEMGMDREDAEALTSQDGPSSVLSDARDEDRYTDMGVRRGQNRVVWWYEEYARFDENEDGVAELLYIQRTADFRIFNIEEMEDDEDHPFEDWCPFPMQHRRIGQSLADKTMDIERINTVLTRQSLDGIYHANNPSTYVHEDTIGENTIEDLLTVRPGRVVRWKGQVPPAERQGNFDPSAGFQMLEYMDRKRETRTGITRLNQGLDDRALTDTARGQENLQERGDQVEEYVARNFASPLAKLFTKKAKLLKRYGQPLEVPIDGEYVMVDPRQWPDDMIAEPRLGLGSTRKNKRLGHRREIMGMQAQAMEAQASGMIDAPLVTAAELFNSAKGYVADAGLGDVTEFFKDPTKPQIDPATGQPIQKQPQQEKPDPAMMKVQMEAQAKQAELQMKLQSEQANMQLKLMEIQGKLALAKEDAQARLVLEQQKAFVEAQLAEQQQRMEAALEQMKMTMQARSIERSEARKDGEAGARIHNMRAGGRLDK